MAESNLSIAYEDLLVEVGRYMGYGVTRSAWSAAEEAELDSYVQSGVRRFYFPPALEGVEVGYAWSFMHPTTTLVTTASDQAQDLPDLLGRVLGNFHFDESQHRRSVVQVSEDLYQAAISRTESTGAPRLAVVRYKDKADAGGQRMEVAWWPIPDAAYTLTYQYEAYSGKLGDDNRFPLGGMRHAELLIQSCLAVAEKRANDETGQHCEDFRLQLIAAIEQDRRLSGANFGHMGHLERTNTVPRHGDTNSTYPITYKGDTH